MLSDNEYNAVVQRRNRIDNNVEYFETCRNGRMLLLYLFAAFVIIRWDECVNVYMDMYMSINMCTC
jgi:hypothetical protein